MLTADQSRALELARSDQRRAQHLTRVADVLKERLSASDNANDKMHRQAMALQREQSDMKQEMRTTRAANAELEARLRDAEDRLARMRRAVEQAEMLEKQHRLVREQRDRALEELSATREELEEERSNSRKLTKEMEELEASFGINREASERKSLGAEIAELEVGLAALATALAQTQAALSHSQGEHLRVEQLALWLQEQLGKHEPEFARLHTKRRGLGRMSAIGDDPRRDAASHCWQPPTRPEPLRGPIPPSSPQTLPPIPSPLEPMHLPSLSPRATCPCRVAHRLALQASRLRPSDDPRALLRALPRLGAAAAARRAR